MIKQFLKVSTVLLSIFLFCGCTKQDDKSYTVKYYARALGISASINYKNANGEFVKKSFFTDFETSFIAESGYVAELIANGGATSVNVGTPQNPRFVTRYENVEAEIWVQGEIVKAGTNPEVKLSHELE
jgi:hypothetical protein